MQAVALLLVLALLAPQPAEGQLGFIIGLGNLIGSGLSALSGIMSQVSDALRNVIGPLLDSIHNTLSAIQTIVQQLFDFQREVIYPEDAIAAAQGVVGAVAGIYSQIRAIWQTVIRSATLPRPRSLEDVILSGDPGQIPNVGRRFADVYTPLPAATEVHPAERDLIDMSDAVAQAAMKRAIAIDAIADQEMEAAEYMFAELAGTAPGTAEMIGAQAGAWLVRSHAYTQHALAELMRVRALELAAQSARMKAAARYTRESRQRIENLNR
ncbi:MAG: hypothetical protein KIT09_16010 [Bryobacteraceae bacterium]|nr:hypothetical protein [Bryobacteraceae bacterium]